MVWYVQRKHIDAMKKIDCVEVTQTLRVRRTLKKTGIATVRHDFNALNLTDKIGLEQTDDKSKITVAHPSYRD